MLPTGDTVRTARNGAGYGRTADPFANFRREPGVLAVALPGLLRFDKYLARGTRLVMKPKYCLERRVDRTASPLRTVRRSDDPSSFDQSTFHNELFGRHLAQVLAHQLRRKVEHSLTLDRRNVT
jgi:hypothetical protein